MVVAGSIRATPKPQGFGHDVLVLNQNYEPLNVTSLRRAVALVVLEKAEVLETDGVVFHSERIIMPGPSVVRLLSHVRRPMPQLKLTRASVFARDNSTCQYCGKRGDGLTVDHVVPRARGGVYDWHNLVTCCLACNNRKGSRTPPEAGMRPLRAPRRPRFTPYISLPRFLAAYRLSRWQTYLGPFIEYAEFME